MPQFFRPLNGFELQQLLVKRVRERLANDYRFRAHLAYPQVVYEITIKLNLYPAEQEVNEVVLADTIKTVDEQTGKPVKLAKMEPVEITYYQEIETRDGEPAEKIRIEEGLRRDPTEEAEPPAPQPPSSGKDGFRRLPGEIDLQQRLADQDDVPEEEMGVALTQTDTQTENAEQGSEAATETDSPMVAEVLQTSPDLSDTVLVDGKPVPREIYERYIASSGRPLVQEAKPEPLPNPQSAIPNPQSVDRSLSTALKAAARAAQREAARRMSEPVAPAAEYQGEHGVQMSEAAKEAAREGARRLAEQKAKQQQ